jgi:hypothetical protein
LDRKIRLFEEIIDDKTREFTGRKLFIEAIHRTIGKSDFTSGYILITGEPGIGKSALISRWIRSNDCVRHFNIASEDLRSPQLFLENVCAQLITRYKLPHYELPIDAGKSSRFLLELLREARATSAGSAIVVAIDAIDESDVSGIATGSNRLLLPRSLPHGVYVVVTSRELSAGMRLDVERLIEFPLRDSDVENRQDIEAFTHARLTNDHRLRERLKEFDLSEQGFVHLIVERSEGNFLYLVYILNALSENSFGYRGANVISDLPRGLKEYYERHWRQMQQADPIAFQNEYAPILKFLATAQGAVTVELLGKWAKLEAAQVRKVLREWRQFLNESLTDKGEQCYRIYHTSFREFLEVEGVGLAGFHNTILSSLQEALKPIRNPEEGH